MLRTITRRTPLQLAAARRQAIRYNSHRVNDTGEVSKSILHNAKDEIKSAFSAATGSPKTLNPSGSSSSSSSGAAEKVKEGAKAFEKDGSIGSKFEADGEIGSKADQVGGPFSKDGVIGKHFTSDGAIGGTGQKAAETAEKAADEKK
ncbi:hypothetical protein SAICODRAFT_138019 [Saitoella complicata NRRL Y-17804]|uniref:Uncharacterized protein n=1 Tax=Saitoella complicata (strain BCRC 22490 / CBS 7301 / JCM 7358 / NBRC 10748 / NRRL Y-17804) TaxID=698492 RepID=A0A0E9NJI3_SAICN|nr:uncharacterized protein SAICODRAFT_138019 [Saitoella complicata NRRL Y-17804]ODQ52181.1 hypothetical protein SAICODRAFT_138019 [Saitoella complicata NRRL Y-17804]GAO49560.1 hypothetical protein G7K_3709-t1 [Saitoella complicata NRRL Y-17804]